MSSCASRSWTRTGLPSWRGERQLPIEGLRAARPAARGCGSSRARSPRPPRPLATRPAPASSVQSAAGGVGREVRMDADRRADDCRMLSSQLQRAPRGGQVVARHQQPLDAGRRGSGHHLVAIGVEGRVLQMAVRVDQTGQRGRPAWAQDGTSTAAFFRHLHPREERHWRADPRAHRSRRPRRQRPPGRQRPSSRRRRAARGAWRRPTGVKGATRWPRMRHVSPMAASTWPSRSASPALASAHGACDSAYPFRPRTRSIMATSASSRCWRSMASR